MRSNGNHTTRRVAAGLLVAGLAFGLAACSDDDEDEDTTEDTTAGTADAGDTDAGDADEGAASGAGITIADFAFSEASAAAGATVSVTNEDGSTHTVTSDDDAWDEVSVGGGESGELTAPSEPGEYPFHCEIHRQMTGTLVVE
jgi:plastocyanin